MKKTLRSGYTTGACAAAASKAAAIAMLTRLPLDHVDIPFPDGSRAVFQLCRCEIASPGSDSMALASVIKDAGDDPDITNGAEIVAVARRRSVFRNSGCIEPEPGERIVICGGKGIGDVTKPGLSVPVGQPAINPVPRVMIRHAVTEAIASDQGKDLIEVTISVPDGERLAMKTLNRRLGIKGGLSILGTTGIVRPVSAEAWTETISASMNVARESGVREIVISTGRTSEKAVQSFLGLPDEAFVMMGDYLHFSLMEASGHGFSRIHYAAMWAKVMKAAMGIPHTHVRYGALDTEEAIFSIARLGADEKTVRNLSGSNTAREIHDRLLQMERNDLVYAVCSSARKYAENISGLPVCVYLVSSSGEVELNV